MNAGDNFRSGAGLAYLNLVTPTLPANLYAALFTDSVTVAGVGTEVSGGSYARQVLPAAAFTQTGGNVYSLTSDLFFPQATANWGTIVSVCITSASVGALAGTLSAFGDLDSTVTINTSDTFRLVGGTGFVLTIT
ncbi:MAG: hypothetical protein WBG86_14465 [Polyangiales bacterium]